MKELITGFYEAFARLDADEMNACYHEAVTFRDPAFGKLRGEDVRNMWRMLCETQQNSDFKLTYSDVYARGDRAGARWEARYTFSPTGRRVHNIIHAEMTLQDGKIIRHVDHFNLYRWARQAMGWKGLLFGWTPFFRSGLQRRTGHLLARYTQKNK